MSQTWWHVHVISVGQVICRAGSDNRVAAEKLRLLYADEEPTAGLMPMSNPFCKLRPIKSRITFQVWDES